MGSGQISGGGGINGGVGGSNSSGIINNNGSSCCDMSMKCWCRWRLENQHYYNRIFNSGFVFFFGCFVLFGSIASKCSHSFAIPLFISVLILLFMLRCDLYYI
jgi:hypothetical protein